MTEAGIDMKVFKTHSTQSACTSAAKAADLPVQDILDGDLIQCLQNTTTNHSEWITYLLKPHCLAQSSSFKIIIFVNVIAY